MKFDRKIAVTLLRLISALTPEANLLQDYEIPREWLLEMSPELFSKTTAPVDVLGHLLVLSHSGLIYPPSDTKPLKEWLALIPAEKPNDPEYNPMSELCYSVLPKLLPSYFLTVQGYEFLEKHQH